jgi:uncharacterized protein (TIGR03437 family)
VPVLYAAQERIHFVCPGDAPGTTLSISVENAAGRSDPAETVMNLFAPGLFSLDSSGTGQGSIRIAGTSLIAMNRNYQAPGQPVQPGDSITIQATGIAPAETTLAVKIGEMYAQVTSVEAVPGMAGVYEVTAIVPPGIGEGDSIPVTVMPSARKAGGRDREASTPWLPATLRGGSPGVPNTRPVQSNTESNTVTIAIERGQM